MGRAPGDETDVSGPTSFEVGSGCQLDHSDLPCSRKIGLSLYIHEYSMLALLTATNHCSRFMWAFEHASGFVVSSYIACVCPQCFAMTQAMTADPRRQPKMDRMFSESLMILRPPGQVMAKACD
jgi:hypothetical protein